MVHHLAAALATVTVAAVAARPGLADAAAVVHPNVHRTLRRQGAANVIVRFKEGTTRALRALEERSFDSREDRIAALVTGLEDAAERSQRELDGILLGEERSGAFEETRRLWISNEAAFRGASVELVERLRGLPSVAEIREERVLPLPGFVPVEEAGGLERRSAHEVVAAAAAPRNSSSRRQNWGLDKIQVPSLWDAGYTGKGVIIGAIDTGVRHTHEAIKSKWRRGFGWFDAIGKKLDPEDDVGHGTHVVGTMVGAQGIGVAPDATWMMCRACSQAKKCPEAELLACAEFLLCPTDPRGQNKDCTKAPHVINNSWGGGDDPRFFQAAITAWRAAGIIPIFAVGNSGPQCGTVSSPADSKSVITVGGTDASDTVASFSSKGPTKDGAIKPNLVAPGAAIRSSMAGRDDEYSPQDGSSTAAPHVTGTVALLLSAKPGLDYETVKTLLVSTAVTQSLGPSKRTCGDTADTSFPNNQYGAGRLNALGAFEKLMGSRPSPRSNTPVAATSPSRSPSSSIPTRGNPTSTTTQSPRANPSASAISKSWCEYFGFATCA